MPIIAQQLVSINTNDDLSIYILDEIHNCGCIKTSTLSLEINIPLEQLKNTLRHIAEKNDLKCDSNYEVCCSNSTTFDKFVINLNKLSEG